VEQLAETKRDENGVPILKGYRPPFKKGYDPRRYKGNVRYRMITLADANRLLAKMEAVLDALIRKSRKLHNKPRLQKSTVAPSVAKKMVSPIRASDQNAAQVKPERVKSAGEQSTQQSELPPGQA
jgi:hypothetical protein